MIALQKHLGLCQHRRQKLGSDIAFQQPVAVLREHRLVLDRIVDANSDEPAEQQILIQPLHQKPFRADRINACNSIARSSFSGGMEGRPIGE